MSDLLKIFPVDVRTSASDFRKMGEQAHQIQDTLTRAWARLDAGWEDYAESGIQSHYSEAMNELSLMIAMFEQMDQALVQSVDGIEAADKAGAALFIGDTDAPHYQVFLPLVMANAGETNTVYLPIVMAGSDISNPNHPGPSIEDVLEQIKILEKYYDNKTIASLLLAKIFEPEAYWNIVVPSTFGYGPGKDGALGDIPIIGLNSMDVIYIIPSLEGGPSTVYIDQESWDGYAEVKAALEKLNKLMGCGTDGGMGCQDDPRSGDREKVFMMQVPGIGNVHLAHVIVGLAAYYSPSSTTNVAGFGNSMATSLHIGDVGGAVADYLLGAPSLSNPEQPYASLADSFAQQVYEPNGKRPDLDADVDAYSLARMLAENPDLRISDALAAYYQQPENPYHNTRWQYFEQQVLNLPPAGADASAQQQELGDQISRFAHVWMTLHTKDASNEGITFPRTLVDDLERDSNAYDAAGFLIKIVREMAGQERQP